MKAARYFFFFLAQTAWCQAVWRQGQQVRSESSALWGCALAATAFQELQTPCYLSVTLSACPRKLGREELSSRGKQLVLRLCKHTPNWPATPPSRGGFGRAEGLPTSQAAVARACQHTEDWPVSAETTGLTKLLYPKPFCSIKSPPTTAQGLGRPLVTGAVSLVLFWQHGRHLAFHNLLLHG